VAQRPDLLNSPWIPLLGGFVLLLIAYSSYSSDGFGSLVLVLVPTGLSQIAIGLARRFSPRYRRTSIMLFALGIVLFFVAGITLVAYEVVS